MNGAERFDDAVRRDLASAEAWLRSWALLGLGAWTTAEQPSTELFQALSGLTRPAFGTWNGLLGALRKVRRDALRAASAVLRGRIEAATALTQALDLVARRLTPPEVERLAPLATLVRRRDRPRTLGDAVEAAIALRNRVAHDPPADANDPWWAEAAAAVAPLVELLGAHPPGATAWPSPWFLAGPEPLAFNGLEDDFAARYVGVAGARGVSSEQGAEVMRSIARLLGREPVQDGDLRRTLGRVAPEETSGVLLGDLLLTAEVGAGGWATVYRATQLTTGRRVAVKVLHDSARETARARFRQEAELLSRVTHPHVVAVLDQGEDPWRLPRSHSVRAPWIEAWTKGAVVRSYLVLEWIEGPTLEARYQVWHGEREPREPRADDRTLLGWLRDAARAVEAVHTAGLIHRDVKPGNLMLGADGRIKLLDLGIARSQDEGRTLVTTTGTALGTPAYMAPEQLEARDAEAAVGPRADVYGLAATFYELWTGRRLFDHGRDAAGATTRKLAGAFPDRPRALVRRLPREVESILLGALEPVAADRYPSASALADDCERTLRDEPLRFRPPGPLRRVSLAYRRNRTAASLSTLFVLLAGAGVARYVTDVRRERDATEDQRRRATAAQLQAEEEAAEASRQRIRAEDAAVEARRQRDEAERAALQADVSRHEAILSGLWTVWQREREKDPARVVVEAARLTSAVNSSSRRAEQLETAVHIGDAKARLDSLRRSARTAAESAVADAQRVRGSVIAGAFSPTCVAWSRDGRHVLAGSTLGNLAIWDAATGRPLRVLEGHPEAVTACAFSPDGQRALSASGDCTLRLWDVETGQTLRILEGHSDGVTSCAFSRDGRRALSASQDSTLRLWDLEAGQLLDVRESPSGPVTACALSPDCRRALSVSGGSTVHLWDLEAPGERPRVLDGHTEWASSCTFSPDGRRVLWASADGTLRLSDVGNDPTIHIFKGHKDKVLSCVFSPDGQRVLSSSEDNTLCLWNVGANGTPLAVQQRPRRIFEGHADQVSSCAFSPDGARILSASKDCTLRLWDVETGQILYVLDGSTFRVDDFAFSPDGRRALSASGDHTLRLWDIETGQTLRVLKGHLGWVNACAFSPDGRRALSASTDKTLRLWDLETGQTLRVLVDHTGGVNACAFSADGRRALSASDDCTLRLWDIETGKTLRVLEGHKKEVWSCEFSPEDRRALSASKDTTLRLWDLETGQPLVLEGHTSVVTDCAFSSDGRHALSASGDKTLRLWDLETGQTLLPVLEGHTAGVMDCAFSPDGRRALSASFDKTLRLWDLDTRKTLRVLEGHTDWVNACAFSPDGRRALSASKDRTLRLWNIESGQTFEGHADRVLSCVFSPDGRRALSASEDDTLRLWDVETGQTLRVLGRFDDARGDRRVHRVQRDYRLAMGDAPRPLEGHADWVLSCAFSPDGRRALSASEDRTLRLWDVETGQTLLPVLEGHTDRVLSCAFSSDGRRVLSASEDKTLRLWDVETRRLLHILPGHTSGVLSCAFSPDGRRALSASADKTLRLWDVATGQPLLPVLGGHTSGVLSCAFSPDGRRALSASADKTLRLWNVETGQTLRVLEGHTNQVTACAFSPDGRRALSASADSTLRLWDVETGQTLRVLEGHLSGATACAFSPDGRRALSASEDRTLRLWDLGPTPEVFVEDGVSIAPVPVGARLALGRIEALQGDEVPRFVAPIFDSSSAPLDLARPDQLYALGLDTLLGRTDDPQAPPAPGAISGRHSLRAAAEMGHAPAMTRLAWALNRSLGGPLEDATRTEAAALTSRAAALGDLLARGDVDAAAAAGDSLACVLQAVARGELPALRDLALRNEPDAILALADRLSVTDAVPFLERGAAIGDPTCVRRLGEVLLRSDPIRAVTVLVRAATLGDFEAHAALAAEAARRNDRPAARGHVVALRAARSNEVVALLERAIGLLPPAEQPSTRAVVAAVGE